MFRYNLTETKSTFRFLLFLSMLKQTEFQTIFVHDMGFDIHISDVI